MRRNGKGSDPFTVLLLVLLLVAAPVAQQTPRPVFRSDVNLVVVDVVVRDRRAPSSAA